LFTKTVLFAQKYKIMKQVAFCGK